MSNLSSVVCCLWPSCWSGSLVAVNCAAVVETLTEAELFGHERGAFTGATECRLGCFERASGGTLFLDEIGDSSQAFQAKLLRVLDRSEFYRVGGQDPVKSDVRVISATNCDLEDLIRAGGFRKDLYYRLSEVVIPLPALRDRRLDFPLLLSKILSRINLRLNRKIVGVSRDVMDRLVVDGWPGNIRGMQNVITRPVGCSALPGRHCAERSVVMNSGRQAEIIEFLRFNGWNCCRPFRIDLP